MTKKQYEQAMADIAMLEKAGQLSAELAQTERNNVQAKYDNSTPPKEKKEKPQKPENSPLGQGAEKPAETTSYLNPANYEECAEKLKALESMRRANKVATLKQQALKTAKTAKERTEINAKNSVQDFTQGENAKTKVAKSFKSILDYAERQRIKTLAGNPNDKEKTLYFKNNREMLETAQEKVAKEAQRALERFVVELHKRFEAGEDISKADFVVSINF